MAEIAILGRSVLRARHPGPPGRRTPAGIDPEEAPMPVLANIIGPELLIVLAVVALLFGGSRLPHLARSLGSAKGEFERGLRDDPADEDATHS
jgi:sec-independent protein translocase protein TatA